VVAELRPAGSTTQPMVSAEGLAELARRGEATPGGAHDAALYAPRPPVLDPGQLETLLDAERAE
jgi:hypothetical protein